MNNQDEVSGNMPDLFDRTIGGLHGVPGVLSTKPTTKIATSPLLGRAQTFIVQTYRHPVPNGNSDEEKFGETVFLQYMDGQQTFRIVIPPMVTETIHRQHDSLAVRLRSMIARAQAKLRKEAGHIPFVKKVVA